MLHALDKTNKIIHNLFFNFKICYVKKKFRFVSKEDIDQFFFFFFGIKKIQI